MTASPTLWSVWTDVLWCMGIGLAVALMRDWAGVIFGASRPVQVVLDLAAFASAAILICGFAAGASSIGTVRWYMAVAAVLGAMGWRYTGSQFLHHAVKKILALLVWPFRLFRRWVTDPLARYIHPIHAVQKSKKTAQKRQKQQKKKKKILQKPGRILYN